MHLPCQSYNPDVRSARLQGPLSSDKTLNFQAGASVSVITLRAVHNAPFIFYTEWCKIIPTCLNFRGLAPASLSNQPQPAKSAIFAKIGRKTINLARLFLHSGVHDISLPPCLGFLLGHSFHSCIP